MTHVYLETGRLTIRRFTPDDVDNLVELDSDPDVIRYVTRHQPSREEVIARVSKRIAYYDEKPGFGVWAAVERVTGDFIGWFHLYPADDDGSGDEPELGYRLRRPAWGKGYATVGSRALIDKAFTDLNARRVFATTMAVNGASRRVMEKAGMRFVRAFVADWPEQLPGDEHGDVEYAISREEWTQDRRRQDAGGGT